jgi:hypothetical protein
MAGMDLNAGSENGSHGGGGMSGNESGGGPPRQRYVPPHLRSASGGFDPTQPPPPVKADRPDQAFASMSPLSIPSFFNPYCWFAFSSSIKTQDASTNELFLSAANGQNHYGGGRGGARSIRSPR